MFFFVNVSWHLSMKIDWLKGLTRTASFFSLPSSTKLPGGNNQGWRMPDSGARCASHLSFTKGSESAIQSGIQASCHPDLINSPSWHFQVTRIVDVFCGFLRLCCPSIFGLPLRLKIICAKNKPLNAAALQLEMQNAKCNLLAADKLKILIL